MKFKQDRQLALEISALCENISLRLKRMIAKSDKSPEEKERLIIDVERSNTLLVDKYS